MNNPLKWLVAVAFALLILQPGNALADNTSGVAVPTPPKFKKSNAAVYGKQIAYYADAFDSGWADAYDKSTITIINAGGEKTSSTITRLTLEGEGGNKALIRYMSPASVRGVASLTHENHSATDDSWLYLPSSRRVRRISGANRKASFQGTEFTYEDLTSFVPSRYKFKFLKEVKVDGVTLLQVEGIPTYKNSGYSKLHYLINPDNWRAERITYYDKGGRLLKVLNFTEWKLYHGRFWRAHKFDMLNKQSQKRSIVDISTMFLNISKYKKKDGTARSGLQESAFTKRALEAR